MKTEIITTADPLSAFNEEVATHLAAGWRIVSDGPTGIQIEEPRRVRKEHYFYALGAFVLLFVVTPLGFVGLIACGVAHYRQARGKVFLKRPTE